MEWVDYILFEIGVGSAKRVTQFIFAHMRATVCKSVKFREMRNEKPYQPEDIMPLALGIGPPKITNMLKPVKHVIVCIISSSEDIDRQLVNHAI